MDGEQRSYEELLEQNQRQDRELTELRAEVDRLRVAVDAQAVPAADDDPVRGKVERAAGSYMDKACNIGLVVGVIRDAERRVFGFGRVAKDSEAIPDETTLFEIGSITKVFTANLLADMVDRGLVKLDDPIHKYLPSTVTVPKREEKDITLAHLATHTSGLPRLPANLDLTKCDPANPYAHYTVEELYAALGACSLRWEPGAGFEYSNLGAGLLGHILGLVAGQSFEDLVVARICDPLGMNDTRIKLVPDQLGRLARGHAASGEPTSGWDLPTLAGAGALRSSCRDMLAYLAANLGEAKGAIGHVLEECRIPRVGTAPLRPAWLRWGVAVMLAGLSVALQLSFGRAPSGSQRDLLWLIAPIILSTLYGGSKAGLVTTLLYTAAVRYFWMQPAYSLALNSSAHFMQVGAHLVAGAALAWLVGRKWRTGSREQIALGWMIAPLDRPGMRMLWHNGGTGGYASFMGLVRERRTAVVVMSNSGNSVDNIGNKLLNAL